MQNLRGVITGVILIACDGACAGTREPDATAPLPRPTEVRVLVDSIDLPPESDANQIRERLGTPPVEVRYFTDADAMFTPRLNPESAMHTGGCSCSKTSFREGFARVTFEDGQTLVSTMCGHVWSIVHSEPFSYGSNRWLSARASLKRVVETGWETKGGCHPAPAGGT